MSPLRMTQVTAEQALERGLSERVEIVQRARPTPLQVIGVWLENAGVGLGGALGAAIVLSVLQAPGEVLINGTLLTGGAVFAGMMIWRGSQDELSEWRNTRHIRHAWRQLEKEYEGKTNRMQAQLERALDALDEADHVEAQLRRSLDEMTRQRDRAVYDLTREREQASNKGGRNTFVAPAELAPQDVRDATEMIRYRYDTGEHLSRRKAVDTKGWSERQWDAAKATLDSAAVIRIVKGQTEYPQTMDEALATFGEYMLHVRSLSVPTVNKTAGRILYVESEEGEKLVATGGATTPLSR